MSENTPIEPLEDGELDANEAKAEEELSREGGTPGEEPEFPDVVEDVDPEIPDVTVNPASFAALKPTQNGRAEKANLDMLLDIGLQVTVELGRAKMSIRDVLGLGPGTVVELNRVAGEPVDVLINGKPIAKGEVVVIGDMFGVRVTDIIPPAQRVESMM